MARSLTTVESPFQYKYL